MEANPEILPWRQSKAQTVAEMRGSKSWDGGREEEREGKNDKEGD